MATSARPQPITEGAIMSFEQKVAGESVGQTKQLMGAASIIDEMIGGAEAVIRNRLRSMVVD
jgi:hypothetical protein